MRRYVIKAGAIRVEPCIDAGCNSIENLNRVAFSAVNDDSRFNMQGGNTAAGQIG